MRSLMCVCRFGKQFDTYNRMTEFLNVVMAADDVHYFQILGDNFYDQVRCLT
jgi:hypothetical protein